MEKKVTPAGEAKWVYTRTTEKSPEGADTGKYSATIHLGKKEAAALMKYLKPQAEAVMNHEKFQGKKFNAPPKFGMKELYEDGSADFKFATGKFYKNRAGEKMERKVFVFDAKQKPVAAQIGNGSKIKVGFYTDPYWMSKDNYGVTLRLLAIQVLDLKEFTGGGGTDAASFGFGDEEGYEAMADFDSGMDLSGDGEDIGADF